METMDATYWRERITSALVALGQEQTMVVGEPEAAPEKNGILTKLRSKAHSAPRRWGQALCVDEVLYVEFEGTQHIGGAWQATEEQHQAIRDAGWLAPGDHVPIGTPPRAHHYWLTVPQVEAELVAELFVDAFVILGADLESLTLEQHG